MGDRMNRRRSPYHIRVGPTQPDVSTMVEGQWVLWVDTGSEPHSLKCWHPEQPDQWHYVVGDPATLGGDGNLPHAHPELANIDHAHTDLATAQSVTDHAATPHGTQAHPIDSVLHTGAATVLPTAGQKNALAGTQGTPGTTNPYVTTQDARLSDARPPTAHNHDAAYSATSHTHSYAATSHTHPYSDVGHVHSIADGDVPASIARDSEVTSAIATHAATPHGSAGVYATPSAATTALDLATNATVKVTPGANITYTTTVPPATSRREVIVVQSNTTAKTITFGTGFKVVGTLAAGTTANRQFVVSFVSDGTNLIETSRTAAIPT